LHLIVSFIQPAIYLPDSQQQFLITADCSDTRFIVDNDWLRPNIPFTATLIDNRKYLWQYWWREFSTLARLLTTMRYSFVGYRKMAGSL
jgi:hypothetical protein